MNTVKKFNFKYLKTTHSYHLVDPSSWPIMASLGAFALISVVLLYLFTSFATLIVFLEWGVYSYPFIISNLIFIGSWLFYFFNLVVLIFNNLEMFLLIIYSFGKKSDKPLDLINNSKLRRSLLSEQSFINLMIPFLSLVLFILVLIFLCQIYFYCSLGVDLDSVKLELLKTTDLLVKISASNEELKQEIIRLSKNLVYKPPSDWNLGTAFSVGFHIGFIIDYFSSISPMTLIARWWW